MSTVTAPTPTHFETTLSVTRINVMRAGYGLMALGLAVVKWPLLPDAHNRPLYEGVTLSLLIAMSLLALLGLRYPVKLLPVLLFESAWKLLWLAVVALPQAVSGPGLDKPTTDVLVNCSLVVLILAVTPWKYTWQSIVKAAGDPWR
jgi:hypothetical protein